MLKTSGGGTMPLIGYGAFPLAGDAAARGVTRALELGCRHVDAAQMYGDEASVGRAVAASGLDRDALFVTTRIHPDNSAPGAFLASVDASPERLRLAFVDMLLLHWPNPRFSTTATLDLLVAARDAGKAPVVGVSNFAARDLGRAAAHLGQALANSQIEFHPFITRSDAHSAADALGVALMTACGPLARGAALRARGLRLVNAPGPAPTWDR